MNKTARFIALLLVLSLVADPVTVSAFPLSHPLATKPQNGMKGAPFESEALTLLLAASLTAGTRHQPIVYVVRELPPIARNLTAKQKSNRGSGTPRHTRAKRRVTSGKISVPVAAAASPTSSSSVARAILDQLAQWQEAWGNPTAEAIAHAVGYSRQTVQAYRKSKKILRAIERAQAAWKRDHPAPTPIPTEIVTRPASPEEPLKEYIARILEDRPHAWLKVSEIIHPSVSLAMRTEVIAAAEELVHQGRAAQFRRAGETQGSHWEFHYLPPEYESRKEPFPLEPLLRQLPLRRTHGQREVLQHWPAWALFDWEQLKGDTSSDAVKERMKIVVRMLSLATGLPLAQIENALNRSIWPEAPTAYRNNWTFALGPRVWWMSGKRDGIRLGAVKRMKALGFNLQALRGKAKKTIASIAARRGAGALFGVLLQAPLVITAGRGPLMDVFEFNLFSATLMILMAAVAVGLAYHVLAYFESAVRWKDPLLWGVAASIWLTVMILMLGGLMFPERYLSPGMPPLENDLGYLLSAAILPGLPGAAGVASSRRESERPRLLLPNPVLKGDVLQTPSEGPALATIFLKAVSGDGRSPQWEASGTVAASAQKQLSRWLSDGVLAHVRHDLHPSRKFNDVLDNYPDIRIEVRPRSFEEQTIFVTPPKGEPYVRILLDPSLFEPGKETNLRGALYEAAGWLVHGPQTPQEELTAQTMMALLTRVSREALLEAYGHLSLGFGFLPEIKDRETTLRDVFATAPALQLTTHRLLEVLSWPENREHKELVATLEDWVAHILKEIDRKFPNSRNNSDDPDDPLKHLMPVPPRREAPLLDPWIFAMHVLDEKYGVGEIVENAYDAPTTHPEVIVEFPGREKVLRAKNSVKPLVTLAVLSHTLGVAYPTLKEAVGNGWLNPDFRQADGYKVDLFSWDKFDAIHERFNLRYSREQVLDVNELAGALGKPPGRIHDLIRMNKLTPAQTIWTGDIRGTPFFLREDLPGLIERFTPEKVAHAFSPLKLALALGRPERIVMRAIASPRFQLKRIGPSGNPHYIVPPDQWGALKEAVMPVPRPKDKTPLRYPEELVVNQYQLAQALGLKRETRLALLIHRGDLEPIQSVWKDGPHVTHYFLKSELQNYKRSFAPQLAGGISLRELARKLKSSPRIVADAIRDRLIEPREVLGVFSAPFYIVPEEDLELFKRALHPENHRIAIDALSRRWKVEKSLILTTADFAGVPIQVQFSRKRKTTTIDLAHVDTVKQNLPPPVPPGMITRHDLPFRLGVGQERVQDLPADYSIRRGASGKLFHNLFKEKGLPDRNDRVAVEAWLLKRQQMSPLLKRGKAPMTDQASEEASAPPEEPEASPGESGTSAPRARRGKGWPTVPVVLPVLTLTLSLCISLPPGFYTLLTTAGLLGLGTAIFWRHDAGKPVYVKGPALAQVNEIKTWLIYLIGGAFGRRPADIEKVQRETKMHLGVSSAQSRIVGTHMHMFRTRDVDTLEGMAHLILEMGSEIGHLFLNLAVARRMNPSQTISAAVHEMYDEFGRRVALDAIRNVIPEALVRQEIERRNIVVLESAFLRLALAERLMTVEDFTGGWESLEVLHALGRQLETFNDGDLDTTPAHKLLSVSGIFDFLNGVARDCFMTVPQDEDPRPYPAAHILGIGAVADLILLMMKGDWSVATRLAGQSFSRPVSHFQTLLGLLGLQSKLLKQADWKSLKADIRKDYAAARGFREKLQARVRSAVSDPIRLPPGPSSDALDLRWDNFLAAARALARDAMRRLFPEWEDPTPEPDRVLRAVGERWRHLLENLSWDNPGYEALMKGLQARLASSPHGGQRLLPDLCHFFSHAPGKDPVFTPVKITARTVLRGLAIYVLDRSFERGFDPADLKYLESLIEAYNAQPAKRTRLPPDLASLFVNALSSYFQDAMTHQAFCRQSLNLPEPERSRYLALSTKSFAASSRVRPTPEWRERWKREQSSVFFNHQVRHTRGYGNDPLTVDSSPLPVDIPDFKIRPATLEDLTGLVTLESKVYPDVPDRPAQLLYMLRTFHGNPSQGLFLVATSNQRIIGMCSAIREKDDTLKFENLAVDPDFQGRRVGTLLVQERLRLIKERRSTQWAYGFAEQDSFSAILFEKLGFISLPNGILYAARLAGFDGPPSVGIIDAFLGRVSAVYDELIARTESFTLLSETEFEKLYTALELDNEIREIWLAIGKRTQPLLKPLESVAFAARAALTEFIEPPPDPISIESLVKAKWDLQEIRSFYRRLMHPEQPAARDYSVRIPPSVLTTIKTQEKAWPRVFLGFSLWMFFLFPVMEFPVWLMLATILGGLLGGIYAVYALSPPGRQKDLIRDSVGVHAVSWWYEAPRLAYMGILKLTFFGRGRAEKLLNDFLKEHYTADPLKSIRPHDRLRGWESLPGWKERQWTARLLVNASAVLFLVGLVPAFQLAPSVVTMGMEAGRFFLLLLTGAHPHPDFWSFSSQGAEATIGMILTTAKILMFCFKPLVVTLFAGHEIHNLLSGYPLTSVEARGPETWLEQEFLIDRALLMNAYDSQQTWISSEVLPASHEAVRRVRAFLEKAFPEVTDAEGSKMQHPVALLFDQVVASERIHVVRVEDVERMRSEWESWLEALPAERREALRQALPEGHASDRGISIFDLDPANPMQADRMASVLMGQFGGYLGLDPRSNLALETVFTEWHAQEGSEIPNLIKDTRVNDLFSKRLAESGVDRQYVERPLLHHVYDQSVTQMNRQLTARKFSDPDARGRYEHLLRDLSFEDNREFYLSRLAVHLTGLLQGKGRWIREFLPMYIDHLKGKGKRISLDLTLMAERLVYAALDLVAQDRPASIIQDFSEIADQRWVFKYLTRILYQISTVLGPLFVSRDYQVQPGGSLSRPVAYSAPVRIKAFHRDTEYLFELSLNGDKGVYLRTLLKKERGPAEVVAWAHLYAFGEPIVLGRQMGLEAGKETWSDAYLSDAQCEVRVEVRPDNYWLELKDLHSDHGTAVTLAEPVALDETIIRHNMDLLKEKVPLQPREHAVLVVDAEGRIINVKGSSSPESPVLPFSPGSLPVGWRRVDCTVYSTSKGLEYVPHGVTRPVFPSQREHEEEEEEVRQYATHPNLTVAMKRLSGEDPQRPRPRRDYATFTPRPDNHTPARVPGRALLRAA